MNEHEVDRFAVGIAVARVGNGVLALVAPKTTNRLFSLGTGPDENYLIRLFGSRAIMLGGAYLAEPPKAVAAWPDSGCSSTPLIP